MRGVGRNGVAFFGVIVGLAMLVAFLPSGAQAKKDPYRLIAPPSATGVLEFNVTLELKDTSDWSYDLTDLCDRRTGSGSHTIEAKLVDSLQYWRAYLPVRRTKKGKIVPVPTLTRSLFVDPDSARPPEPQTGEATYRIDAPAPVVEQLNACAPPGGGGGLPPSDPPVWKCGEKTGTVTLESVGRWMTRNVTNIELLDSWSPVDPFNEEGNGTWCQDSSLWAWSDFGLPALYDPYEQDRLVIELENSKLLGYFTIPREKRAKCPGKLKEFCEKRANYTRRTKTLMREETDEPGRYSLQTQESIFTMKFTWVKYTTLMKR